MAAPTSPTMGTPKYIALAGLSGAGEIVAWFQLETRKAGGLAISSATASASSPAWGVFSLCNSARRTLAITRVNLAAVVSGPEVSGTTAAMLGCAVGVIGVLRKKLSSPGQDQK